MRSERSAGLGTRLAADDHPWGRPSQTAGESRLCYREPVDEDVPLLEPLLPVVRGSGATQSPTPQPVTMRHSRPSSHSTPPPHCPAPTRTQTYGSTGLPQQAVPGPHESKMMSHSSGGKPEVEVIAGDVVLPPLVVLGRSGGRFIVGSAEV